MSIINSNILANASGLSTAICIGSLSHDYLASLTGGMAVYCALSVFKDAMREVLRENQPGEAGSPVQPVARPQPKP